MDNGASSYRRFRDNGDERGLDAIIMEYKDKLFSSPKSDKKPPF